MKAKSVYIALVLLLCTGKADAQQASEALAEYQRAGERFSVLVAGAESVAGVDLEGKAEALSNPEFEALVDVLSDHQGALMKSGGLDASLDVSIEICGLSNRAVMTLALFNIKSMSPLDDTSSAINGMNELMTRNTLQFQEELTKMQPFLLRCLAGQMSGMASFTASLPPEQFTEVRRNGIRKVRLGTAKTYVGALLIASEPAFSVEYRRALLSTLAETAEEFVAVMPIAEREVIAAAAARAASIDDQQLRGDAARIESAFKRTDCSRICAIE